MESRDHITVYIADGMVTVQIPMKGVIPDRKTLRSVMAAINSQRRYRHDPDQMGVDRRDRAAGDRIAGSVVTIP